MERASAVAAWHVGDFTATRLYTSSTAYLEQELCGVGALDALRKLAVCRIAHAENDYYHPGPKARENFSSENNGRVVGGDSG